MAPVPIEDRIKDAVPFLNNVMLIGDKRKYVTCLVTIKVTSKADSSIFFVVVWFVCVGGFVRNNKKQNKV